MKGKLSTSTTLALAAGILAVGVVVWTNIFSNSLMLLMDGVNFIPAESSILAFEPYEINQGSSSYWIYGQDGENYYYFSYDYFYWAIFKFFTPKPTKTNTYNKK